MPTTAHAHTEVSQLYVALFGRAPDAGGLAFWAALRESGQSVAQLADAMFATEPARAYFPEGLETQDIIASFYLNVLGRVADFEGLFFWTGKLQAAGATPGSVIAEMISAIANYDGSDPAGLSSAALYNNRVEAARFYGEHNGSIDGAESLLARITGNPQTVIDARVLSVGDQVSASIDASGVGEVVIAHVQNQINLTGLADASSLAFTFETRFNPTFVPQGMVVVHMGQDTGNDVLLVEFRGAYADDHDGQREGHLIDARLDAVGVEVVHVSSSAVGLPSAFAQDVDFMSNVLRLNDPELRTIVITGTQPLGFSAGADMVHLSLVDARGLVGSNFWGETADVGLMFGATLMAGTSGLTILGSTSNANGLTGSSQGDVIVGGSGADTIAGDGWNDLLAVTGADNLTGGEGNDRFLFQFAAESRVGTPDTITDFQPNTVARGIEGYGDPAKAEAEVSLRNGDIIHLPPSDSHLSVAVFNNSADARGFLATIASQMPENIGVALDAHAGRLYVDTTHNGIADMAINLPGVSTITAAAFF